MSVILTNIDMPKNCRDCCLQNCPILDIYSDKNFDCVKREYLTFRHKDCPLKSVKGMIEKLKNESYLSYDGNPRHILDEDAVIHIVKEYCEVKE